MKKSTITKEQIGTKIHQNIGFSKRFSTNFVDNLLQLIISEFKKDQNVKINSFGLFKLSNKKERVGRNPKNRIETTISARKVVSFIPSKKFRNFLNTNER